MSTAIPDYDMPPHPAEQYDYNNVHYMPHVVKDPENGKDESQSIQDLPEWAFWTGFKERDGALQPILSPSLYIDFLASHQFRIFVKRGIPTVVIETDESVKQTEMRGKSNYTIKQFVFTFLQQIDECRIIVDALMLNQKYFTIEFLESLPLVDYEKVKNSIFTEKETRVTFNTPLIKEEPLIAFDGNTVLLPGNILSIVGRQGIGKSSICEIFASLALNPQCEEHSPFTVDCKDGLIIWIDTEQTSNDMVYARTRIRNRTQADKHRLLDEKKEDFKNLQVHRCRTIEDKMLWILELIDNIKEPIALVIIDGALDLAKVSMNSEEEAIQIYDELLQIVEKRECGIIITVHSAPTDEKGKAMGHVGTKIMQKASGFLQIRKSKDDPDITELSTDFYFAKNRHGSDHGIYAAFTRTHGVLHFTDYTPPETTPRQDRLHEQIEEELLWIFKQSKQSMMMNKELIDAYCARTGKSPRTANDHFKKAIEWKILHKEKGFYKLDARPF